MASEQASNHPELGREVAVRDIDRELCRLWQADEARTKASLMNFVIYSETSGSLEANSALIRELTRENACRAILVSLDRSAPVVGTRAWITAHCHLVRGRKSVCCEQIAFAMTGRSVGRLRNVVFAHLASDLPLVLWWQGELSPRFSESLYSVIDRLVVDSSEWRDPVPTFGLVRRALDDSRGRLVLHDLEWSRSYHFRLAVASMFDEPVARRALPSIARVRVVHHPGHRCAALQLLAWLTERSGWRPATELGLDLGRSAAGPEGRVFENRHGSTVAAVLEADPAAPPIGSLELGGDGFVFSVGRLPGEQRLRVRRRIDGADSTSVAPADPDSQVGLVGDQLARGGRNSLLLGILPRFLDLLAGL